MNGEDYRALIFNSARDGNLRRLNIFLEDRSPDWLLGCLTSLPSRTPPIVIAARNGHLDVVRYLLRKGADVSVTGTVTFDGEIIPGAPALWAAAAAGHLNIVRCLVEEGGADIDQTTQSNSSPLRGACYDGHIRIVEYLVSKGANIELANRHGHTPLMIAAFKMRTDVVEFLLKHGADPLRSSAKGNTAMHDASEAGSEPIVRMLLDAGALNVPDDFGATPMMCAALAGHEDVLRLLAKVAPPNETRDAMKLYGATLVDKKMDLGQAIRIWTEALSIGSTMEHREVHPVYDMLVEVDSLSDIRNIIGDPDAIRMQALIMRERILGGFHHETHYFIRYRGAVYCDLGQVDRCFQLWKHALRLQQQHLCALHPATMSTIGAFLDTFILTVNEGIINGNMDLGLRPSPLCREHVLEVLNASIYELTRFSEGDVRIRSEDTLEELEDEERCTEFFMLASLQFILLITRLTPTEGSNKTPTENNKQGSIGEARHDENNFSHTFATAVSKLVKVCGQLSMFPLHAACQDIDKQVTTRFPSVFVIQMLLNEGVDVNCKDRNGNTALHVLLMGEQPRGSVMRLLLECGAKLLARNSADKTCLELFKAKFPNGMSHLRPARHITLAGLAANALQRHRIPSNFRDILPTQLVPFVDLH